MYNCPNCTAPLDHTDGLDTAVCRYCGTKIDLREILNSRTAGNGASAAEAESRKQIRLRELELEAEKENRKKAEEKDYRHMRNIWLLSIAVFIIGAIVFDVIDASWMFLWSFVFGFLAVIDFMGGLLYFMVCFAIISFKNRK